MTVSDLRSVSKSDPCPICHNFSWCCYNDFNIFCGRVEAGSVRITSGGFFVHPLKGNPAAKPRLRGVRTTHLRMHNSEIEQYHAQFRAAIMPGTIHSLATSLGVSAESLDRLGIGWDYDCATRRGHSIHDAGDAMRSVGNRGFSFPMRSHDGTVIGIRIRMESGEKFAVAGSRQGIFIPDAMEVTGNRLLAVEGLTDAAAALDIGFNVIGRPSCSGAESLVARYIQKHKPSEVIIVADGDAPGRYGAQCLACTVLPYVSGPVRVIEPPPRIKDMRAWKAAGASQVDVQAAIDVAATQTIGMRKVVPHAAA